MKEDNQTNDPNKNIYEKYMKNIKQELSHTQLSEEAQTKIINTGKQTARLTNILISLAILLLLLPMMTLFTYMYYGGISGKANNYLEVVAKTIYVTEPNTSLEMMRIEDHIGLFSMEISFETFKRIGKEDYKASDYKIPFSMSTPSFPKRTYYLERPLPTIPGIETETLFHPNARIPFGISQEWEMLDKLPDGTVAEVYVSLSNLMEPQELAASLPSETDLRWFAVHSGFEARQLSRDGLPLTPIGYPAQIDKTTWSPFNGREQTNEQVFLEILELLEKNEEIAVKAARAKSLEISERLRFINEHGIQVYGAVVTGPVPELRKLRGLDGIRAVKVGEVKLWNWK
ncbi:anti-sigma factor [Anaerobacillus alkaliphilus]|uniref:Anti-sigma factor n=1 Tax=Anaerobacillus alkaliphilus TaxID=1548597 RepID=A0A4Q0VNY2_9BACI|nr:anti-sigma factor [Anaerobacillus alkaliphilus]RXI96562.1 anti-sigma factor [Anaerobacillus alkaliphilus]